jgi:hypothetical protein
LSTFSSSVVVARVDLPQEARLGAVVVVDNFNWRKVWLLLGSAMSGLVPVVEPCLSFSQEEWKVLCPNLVRQKINASAEEVEVQRVEMFPPHGDRLQREVRQVHTGVGLVVILEVQQGGAQLKDQLDLWISRVETGSIEELHQPLVCPVVVAAVVVREGMRFMIHSRLALVAWVSTSQSLVWTFVVAEAVNTVIVQSALQPTVVEPVAPSLQACQMPLTAPVVEVVAGPPTVHSQATAALGWWCYDIAWT